MSSSRSLYVDSTVSDSHGVSGVLTRVRVLRIIKGARVSIVPRIKIILVFRLVASQGKYAFRKQNAYLFIDLV